MCVEWELVGFVIDRIKVEDYFVILVGWCFGMVYQLYFIDCKLCMVIFVFKVSYCLYDILQCYFFGEWDVEILVIFFNYELLGLIVECFGIDFKVFLINKDNKVVQEDVEMVLIWEFDVDFVVLVCYMQILLDNFCVQFFNQIINIYYLFLLVFKGV